MKLFLIALFFPVWLMATDVSLGIGWRQDALDWSLAGPNRSPTIMSELEWKEIQMVQISGMVVGNLCANWYYRLNGNYGKVLDGRNVDSDYAGDKRTHLYMKSKNKANRGEAFDLSLGVGHPFCYQCFDFAPLVGGAYLQQHFYMTKGNQVVNTVYDLLGRFHGLKSHYRASWATFWLGMDSVYHFTDDFNLVASIEYHLADYQGRGHWNLRHDFLGNFKHSGNAKGFLMNFGGEYLYNEAWRLGLLTTYRTMRMRHGIDKTNYMDANGVIGIGQGLINSVNWRSLRVEGTLSYVF